MIEANYIYEKLHSFLNIFIDSLPSLILSILIFVIFYVIAEYYKYRVIRKKSIIEQDSKSIIEQESNDNNISLDNNLIYHQINWIIYYSIIVFGLIISLVNLGFNVATIITLLGSLGLALGLAFQETLKNMISGIYIALNRLFNIGDIITLKSLGSLNNTFGKIIDFNLYYTTIINSDN